MKKEIVQELKTTGDEQQLSQQICLIQPPLTPKSELNQPTRVISPNAGKPNEESNTRFDDLSQGINELHTFNQIITQPEPYMQEYEAFGRYVTSALNNLSQRQAILVQNEIQNILTRYRLDMISAPSTSSNNQ